MSAVFTVVGLTVLAGGFAAYSSYEKGKTEQKWNNYNAKIEEQNAATAQRDAAIRANQIRRENSRVKARQRAAFAANGVVGDVGSPLLVQAEQAGFLEMGALETERLGTIEAGRHNQQAVIDRIRGNIAKDAGTTEAVGTILGTASKAAGAYSGIG